MWTDSPIFRRVLLGSGTEELQAFAQKVFEYDFNNAIPYNVSNDYSPEEMAEITDT